MRNIFTSIVWSKNFNAFLWLLFYHDSGFLEVFEDITFPSYEITHVYLYLSSTHLRKYHAPPSDLVFIGPHISVWINSSRSVCLFSWCTWNSSQGFFPSTHALHYICSLFITGIPSWWKHEFGKHFCLFFDKTNCKNLCFSTSNSSNPYLP